MEIIENVFKIFIFYLFSSSFFFSDFTFCKEALCFIIFILWLCLNRLTLKSIFEFITKIKEKRHGHFKISSWDEVFTRLFFFLPRWNFIPVFLIGMSSSWDEILSRQKRVNSKRHFTIDRDDFMNFVCKHPLNSRSYSEMKSV